MMMPNTEEFSAFSDAVRQATETRVQPVLDAHPANVPLPKEALADSFAAIAELGLLAARVPPDLGGSGLPLVFFGRACELLPTFLAVAVGAHEATVKRLSMGASPELIKEYLSPLSSGRLIAGTATSEPNVGSDPMGVETIIEVRGQTLVINGRKLWATNGSVADVLVVVGRLRERGEPERVSRVLVDTRTSPVAHNDVDAVGLQRGHLSELVFEDCAVPRQNLLGSAGDAHSALTSTWIVGRANLGLMGVGIANRALDASLRYVKEREQFGVTIDRHQLIQQKLADMYRRVETARLVCYHALTLLESGVRAAKEASLAKWLGTEAAVSVAYDAMQIHGANGLTREFGLEQMWRDARMLTIPDGTTEIQQLIIGRELTGVRAFRAESRA